MSQNNQKSKYLLCILSIVIILLILIHLKNVYSKKDFSNENGNGEKNETIGYINKKVIYNNEDLNEKFTQFQNNLLVPKAETNDNGNCNIENNILFLMLNTSNLEQHRFRPKPIWTNKIFCVYKIEPIISLASDVIAPDKYYPCGDVILFKNYNKYINELDVERLCKTEEPKKQPIEVLPDSGVNSEVLKPDKYISNYDQPGLKGLKIMVKNGRKPVGFNDEPVGIIKSSNGNNLYIWEPVAPQGFKFLGHMTNFGPTAVKPRIEDCHLRAVPEECLSHALTISPKHIVMSEDIEKQYRIYLVSRSKYIKGYKVMAEDDEIKVQSYDFNKNSDCFQVERDLSDNEGILKLEFVNSAQNDLLMSSYGGIKIDFEKEIENILLQMNSLQLNNFTNNPEDRDFIPLSYFNNKRYKLESFSPKINTINLFINFKKRALAYNEIKTNDLKSQIIDNSNKFNIKFKINGIEYSFSVKITDIEAESEGGLGSQGTFTEEIDPRLVSDFKFLEKLYKGGEKYLDERTPDDFIQIGDILGGNYLGMSNGPEISGEPEVSDEPEISDKPESSV